ncbi:UNVERIFIED_CONTAM: hypothetical protein FKN15_032537 [Acipenser sinensis]
MAVGAVHDNILTTAVLVSPRMRQAAPACELRFWYQVWDSGWFMAVGAVHDNILTTAVLVSPRMRQAAPACELRFWYQVWDSDSLSPDWELPTAAPSRCNQGQFECRNGRCVDQNLVCDFRLDCSDQSDEMDCGNATFDVSDGGWRDHSAGRLEWTVRQNTSSSHGGHLSLSRAHGQLLSKAKALSPVLGPSGPACSMQFSYLLYSNSTFTGGISVSSVDRALGTEVLLWRTHRTRDKWTSVTVSVGARPRGFQIEIAALVDNFVPRVQKVAVDDIAFLNCTPDLESPTAADVSCNFEAGLCGWYQDQTDELEWIHDVGPGFDHTTGSGHFVFVDVSSPDLRGRSARLLSYPQRSSVETMCLSFWYHLFGPHTGFYMIVDTSHDVMSSGQSASLYSGLTSALRGPECLVFEALRDGFDGDISLDDITLSSRPCSALQSCSFEASQCDFVSSGRGGWRKQSGWTGGIASGPKTDHTLETDRGFYMIVDTSHDVMSSGQSASLYSGLTSALRGPECVQFWYHMSGDKPESVTQGAAWRLGNANISASAEWKQIPVLPELGGQRSHWELGLRQYHPEEQRGVPGKEGKKNHSGEGGERVEKEGGGRVGREEWRGREEGE